MAIIKDINEKRQALKKLVDTFKKNYDQYQAAEYKEQRIRTDYLNKFFELFDWDISNEEGAIEEFRDVVIEDNLEISGAQKSPDFSFRIGSDIVFYVEAKKPSVNIKEAIPPAFQLRRYGHSAGLKISILTDFHEFAIYDTTVKPSKNDKPSVARLFYCTYEEYEKQFDFLYGVLAKENVRKGSIKDYITGSGVKKGTSQLDKEFLKLIETWRSELAKNIARNNKRADIGGINMAVQKIIDRVIFLRIAEEKGIELYENLLNISKREKDVFKLLAEYFDKANRKYNSELFKHEAFINDLYIDDDVLSDIISGLYYPECPYAFSVLPVEILGNIYEQFLGKTIRLTEGHQAKIEEKPEVRKAGGVYYTPKYIVDYIVKNTVGEKAKGAAPKEIEKLKILDPACGSGSFLLGAYSYLLNHHLAYYTKRDNINKAIKNGNIFQAHANSYRLTIQEKQKILLNNIFGVDIDAQAVEVTKLSLLLKLMEGESDESAGQLFKHSDVKLLPNLSDNIKCGNSLISPDFYKGKNLSLFNDEAMRKINVFDWNDKGKGFGEIMARGGFDCVIGNPPYLFITEISGVERDYFFDSYDTSEYRFDVYGLFIEKSITELLQRKGALSFIVPHTLLANDSFSKLRKCVLENSYLSSVVDIGPNVFQGARNETMIFIAQKVASRSTRVVSTNSEIFPAPLKSFTINQKEWSIGPKYAWNVNISPNELKLIARLNGMDVKLGDICSINQGLRTGDNARYLSNSKKSNIWKHAAGGKEVGRYKSLTDQLFVYYDSEVLDAPRRREIFDSPEKLVVQEIRNITLLRRIIATYDNRQFYCLQSTNVINALPNKTELKIKYLLGALNSNLINYFFRKRFPSNNHIASNQLAQIPIASPNSDQQNNMVALVDQMLAAQKAQNQKKIDLLDKRIDDLVYELYRLTKEEIKMVEGME